MLTPATVKDEDQLTKVAKSFVEQWRGATRKLLMNYLASEANGGPNKRNAKTQDMVESILNETVKNRTELEKTWMKGLNVVNEDDTETDPGSGSDSEDEDDEWQEINQKEIDKVENSKPLVINDERSRDIFGMVVRLIDPKSEEA